MYIIYEKDHSLPDDKRKRYTAKIRFKDGYYTPSNATLIDIIYAVQSSKIYCLKDIHGNIYTFPVSTIISMDFNLQHQ